MGTRKMSQVLFLALGLMVCMGRSAGAEPLGTAFTYQGRLMDADSPADGLYDLRFVLYDSLAEGNQVGRMLDANDWDIIDGYFAVELDFGDGDPNVFSGEARWLETAVRPGDSNEPNDFVVLLPRQEILPVPYSLLSRAIFVDTGRNVGIGTTDPEAKLDLIGQIRITDGTEGLGRVLTCVSDSGLGSWQDLPVGGIDDDWLRDGKGNMFAWHPGDNVGIGMAAPAALNAKLTVLAGGLPFGVRVDNAGGDGVYVKNAGLDGVSVANAGAEGVFVSGPAGNGVNVTGAGLDGVYVSDAALAGVSVIDAGLDGVSVSGNVGRDGVSVDNAGRHGVFVDNATSDGVFVNNAGQDGVSVSAPVRHGVYVTDAGLDGVSVEGDVAADGVSVGADVAGDGVSVFGDVGGDGVSVGGDVAGCGVSVYGHVAGDGVSVFGNVEGDGVSVSGNVAGVGVHVSLATDNANDGVKSTTDGAGVAVRGKSKGNDGVFGETEGDGKAGVHGVAGPDSAADGVWGESNEGIGVKGESEGNYGVYGETKADDSAGVYGYADPDCTSFGVQGESEQSVGVYGETKADDMAGVAGVCLGKGNGVYGLTFQGRGVYGQSSEGWAGYFVGPKNYFSERVGIGTELPDTLLHIQDGKIKIVDGSQGDGKVLTSDDAGVGTWEEPCCSDSVEGSGTLGYMPMWAGAKWLGDSVISESGGRIGVGKTSPAAKLDVAGDIAVNGSQVINSSGQWVGDPAGLQGPAGPEGPTGPTLGIYDSLGLTSSGDRAAGDAGARTLYNLGDVGIGTTNPQTKLDVRGDIITGIDGSGGNLILAANDTVNEGGQIIWHAAGSYDEWIQDVYMNDMRFFTNSAHYNQVHIGNAGSGTTGLYVQGNVGIGTASPGYKLDVDGDIRCATLHEISDARLKTNVRQLTGMLDKVQEVRGVSFEWNEAAGSVGPQVGRHEIGIVAQELEAVFPELVSGPEDGYKSVDYNKLTAVLVEALKELKLENDDLKRRLEALEKMVGQQQVASAKQVQ